MIYVNNLPAHLEISARRSYPASINMRQGTPAAKNNHEKGKRIKKMGTSYFAYDVTIGVTKSVSKKP